MMKSLKRFLAISLVLAGVGAFSACTTAQDRAAMEQGRQPQEERQAASEEATQKGYGERETTGKAVTNLQDLKPGEAINYYNQQFEQMGYKIQDVDYQPDRVVYDLVRDNKSYQVSLVKPQQEDQVQRIESKEMQSIGASDQQSQKVVQQIEKMPIGKMPTEYVSMMSKLGTVTEYELHHNHAAIKMEIDNKRYQIGMNLDPQKQTVTNIEVEKDIWRLPT